MSWTIASVAALAAVLGVTQVSGKDPQPETVGYEPVRDVTVDIAPRVISVGTAGSALASAAFGLDALQPETYNGDIVLDIIDASPLDRYEKRRLAAGLEAAEAGRADLQRVLSDVRIALAVE